MSVFVKRLFRLILPLGFGDELPVLFVFSDIFDFWINWPLKLHYMLRRCTTMSKPREVQSGIVLTRSVSHSHNSMRSCLLGFQSDTMISIIQPLGLILSVLVVVLNIASADDSFLQDQSFRYVFQDAASSSDSAQISPSWSVLPFSFSTEDVISKKNTLVQPSNGQCMLLIKSGILYYTSLKSDKPSWESMENPYDDWKIMSDLELPDSNLIVEGAYNKTEGTASFYILTPTNVQQVSVSDGGCGKVVSSLPLLAEGTFVLKDIQTAQMQYAPSLNIMFIGSNTGVTALDLTKMEFRSVSKEVSQACIALFWCEEWQTLFVSNKIALWTIKYSNEGGSIRSDINHEWIGGILAYTPTDFAYDSTTNGVWIAERESVHKLTIDGVYWRYGYQQMAPMTNITSVAVHDGMVYTGSSDAGMARVHSNTDPTQLDINIEGNHNGAKDDPWTWKYFYGPRYLIDNTVKSIVPAVDGKGVFVMTSTGASYMRLDSITLDIKAKVMETMQYPRHDRHGIINPTSLKVYGDLSTYVLSCGDNDGLWTSMAVIGLAYRHMSEKHGNEAARASAWRGFEGLERLSTITGAYPRYTARSFCKVSDGNNGCPDSIDPECVDDCWYYAPDNEGWYYKGDTSSDELSGHFAAYAILYDHVAQTEEQKGRVLRLMEGLLEGIIENDLYFISPETGKRTLWGFWNPKELNDMPEHYSERGTNSLEILAWCASAYSITGKDIYYNQFWELVKNHNYVANTLNVKIDSALDENHSDTELIYLAYQTLFYANHRLADDHPRKAALQEMTQLMVPSLQRTWRLSKGELSALWLGIYAGTAQQTEYVSKADLKDATYSLKDWQLDNINWDIEGSQRIDLDISSVYHVRMNQHRPIMRHIRPPQERASTEANNDPFDVNAGGSGTTEYEPNVYLFPYYIMKYHNLLIV